MMAKRVFFNLIMMGVMAGCVGADIGVSETAGGIVVPTDTETPRHTKTATLPRPTPSATNLPTSTPTTTPTLSPTPSYFVREGTPLPPTGGVISTGNIDQIAELAIWGYGSIEQVAFANDDGFMIVQTPIAIYAYFTGTLNEQWRVQAPQGISAMSISADQEWIAYGSYDGTIRLIRSVDGTEIQQWEAHEGEILSVGISSDDSMLASGGRDNYARVWDITTNNLIAAHKYEGEAQHVFFANHDRWLASLVESQEHDDRYIFLNLASSQIEDMFIEEYLITAIDFNNGIFIGPTTYPGSAKVKRICRCKTISSIEISDKLFPNFGYLSSTISPDGSLLALGLESTGVALWQISNGTFLGSFHSEDQATIIYPGKVIKPMLRSGPGPDGTYSVSISTDNALVSATNGYGENFIWEIATGKLIRQFSGLGRWIVFSPDGNTLISGSSETLDIYHVQNGKRIASIPGEWAGNDLFFSPGGTRLANGSRLWNVESGELENAPYGERILGFSSDGLYFYTIAPEWWVRQRATVGLELRRQAELEIPVIEDEYWDDYLENQWYEMGGWRISPDNSFIHASGWELPVISWHVEDGSYKSNIDESPYSISAYSPNGEYFITYGSATGLSAYKSEFGVLEFLYDIPFVEYLADDVIVSPDSKLMVIPAEEWVYVFDLETGERILYKEIPHDAEWFYARSAAVSQDGRLLVVTVGNMMYMYDLESGNLITSMEGHFETIYAITFSPDGTLLATAAYDGTVRLWGIAGD